jgi:hypothetical protein
MATHTPLYVSLILLLTPLISAVQIRNHNLAGPNCGRGSASIAMKSTGDYWILGYNPDMVPSVGPTTTARDRVKECASTVEIYDARVGFKFGIANITHQLSQTFESGNIRSAHRMKIAVDLGGGEFVLAEVRKSPQMGSCVFPGGRRRIY